MASTFDDNNNNMAEAINDIAEASAGTADGVEESTKRPQDHGWEPRTAFNYEAVAPPAPDATAPESTDDAPGWAHNAVRYEWNDDYGDVGPAIPALEAQLFNRNNISSAGSDLRTLSEFVVTQEGPTRIAHVRTVSFFHSATIIPSY